MPSAGRRWTRHTTCTPQSPAPGSSGDALPAMPAGHLSPLRRYRASQRLPGDAHRDTDVPPNASHGSARRRKTPPPYPAPLSQGDLGTRLQAARRLHHGLGPSRHPHRQHGQSSSGSTFSIPTGNPADRHAAVPRHGRPRGLRENRRHVFAHTHPDGSAAMPAMMLANAELDVRHAMPGMAGPHEPIAADRRLPLRLPLPRPLPHLHPDEARQHVETGVFDAAVK